MKYQIILCAGNPPFHKIFEPIISSLEWVIRDLLPNIAVEKCVTTAVPSLVGHQYNSIQRIFFNLHSLSDEQMSEIRDRDWIFNFEQISDEWVHSNVAFKYLRCLQDAICIEYSQKNFEYLIKNFGLGQKILHQFIDPDFSDTCEPRAPAAPYNKQFDFFFVGSLNSRRREIIERIRSAGYSVDIGFNLFGRDLYDRAAHAKHVLNIHFYETKILEVFRIVDFLAQGFSVVTENSSDTDCFGYEFLLDHVNCFDTASLESDLEQVFANRDRASKVAHPPNIERSRRRSLRVLVEKLYKTNEWISFQTVQCRSEVGAGITPIPNRLCSVTKNKLSIDVVIPSYKPDFLRDTIQSVLEADVRSQRRIFVSDNCPDDSVKRVCEEFPVVYYKSRHRYLDNFIAGISLGDGSLIHVLCDDDIVSKDFYSQMEDSFLSHSIINHNHKFWSASSFSNIINDSGEFVVSRKLAGLSNIAPEVIARWIKESINPIGELSGIMFERAWVETVGVQNIFSCTPGKFGAAPDFQLIANLAVSTKFNYIPKFLFSWRSGHAGQETANDRSYKFNVTFWALLNYWRGQATDPSNIFDGLSSSFLSYHLPVITELQNSQARATL
jgi:glycosyltransferase involved in cell wall biosynthesis